MASTNDVDHDSDMDKTITEIETNGKQFFNLLK